MAIDKVLVLIRGFQGAGNINLRVTSSIHYKEKSIKDLTPIIFQNIAFRTAIQTDATYVVVTFSFTHKWNFSFVLL